MSEGMCISVNGHSQVPPGFRFHPTEEELLHYYLKKKVSYQKIDLDVITDVDLNKLEPWDIQDKCKIGTTPQNDWYFFSHKDKKYPTGTRTNRATAAGFWKATGRDKTIFGNGRRIGMRKTLVFYKGRAPHGQKSDWIMHEYRLDDNTTSDANVSNALGDDQATQEEGWVVCRIFKKKNHHKTLESPLSSSSIITEETGTQIISDPYSSEGALDQMLEYMGRSCKEESEANKKIIHSASRFLRPIETNRFMKLPSLESPNSTGSKSCYQPMATENESSITNNHQVSCTNTNQVCPLESGLTNWSALDRLVASHLNGQSETSRQLTFFNNDPTHMGYCNPNYTDHHQGLQFPSLRSSLSLTSNCNSNRSSCPGAQDYNNMINNEMDLWSFTTCTTTTRSSSSSDPLCQLSNYSV